MRRAAALALIIALAGCGSSETPQAGVARRHAEDQAEANRAATAETQAKADAAAATSRGEAEAKAASQGFDAMEKAEKAKR
jgi:hypothetical protein